MTALSPAPELSPEEAARVAVFDAAPDDEVSYAATVERMATAMWETRLAGWDSCQRLATAAIAALPVSPAEAAVLVEGDWIVPSHEAHARDLTKSWADAAQNSGCPASFVARMRSFVEVHDRNYRAALAAQADR